MKYGLMILLLFVGLSFASAQDVYTSSGKSNYKTKKHKGYDPDKLIIGGGINAGLSGGSIAAGLSPFIGYRLMKKLSAGVGVGYLYSRVPYTQVNDKIYYAHAHLIYPSVWARFFVWNNIFVSSSYEYDLIYQTIPLDRYGLLNRTTSNYTNQCVWVGGGLRQPISGRLSIYAELRFELLRQPTSPYLNGPDLRIGVATGL